MCTVWEYDTLGKDYMGGFFFLTCVIKSLFFSQKRSHHLQMESWLTRYQISVIGRLPWLVDEPWEPGCGVVCVCVSVCARVLMRPIELQSNNQLNTIGLSTCMTLEYVCAQNTIWACRPLAACLGEIQSPITHRIGGFCSPAVSVCMHWSVQWEIRLISSSM